MRRQIREGAGIALRTRGRAAAEWLQGLHGDHPRGNGSREILPEKRAQRLVLPTLNITGRPIVQQANSEEVIFRFGDWNGLTDWIAGPEECAELDFVIQQA